MGIRRSCLGLFSVRRATVAVAAGVLTTGCVKPPPAYPFVPMHEAIRRVNANNAPFASVAGGVKASPLDAAIRFREHEGAPARQFSFSGVLGFHEPRDMVLQLREGLGNTVVLQAGSNESDYWRWVKPEIDTLWWGTYPKPAPESAPGTEPSAQDRLSETTSAPASRPASAGSSTPGARSLDDMPIRPDDLIEVLGLAILPTDTTGPGGPVYQPQPTRNVLIFLEYDETGQGYIEKEYHLDRAPPYLVRELLFRDPDGRVRMNAALTDYRPVRGSGSLAAHKIRIEWPSADSWLELRIRRFTLETEPFLSPQNPREQGVRARREVRVGSSLEEPAGGRPGGAM